MLYRIFTENKNRPGIESIVNEYALGYTIMTGVGYWQGQREKSLIIEVDGATANTINSIRHIAQRIKDLNGQQSVMIQQLDTSTSFV